MFQHQLKRVKENILPFISIGFITGFFISDKNPLISIDWLNSYLNYANLQINKKIAEEIFLEHFAPNTLTFLLIAIFTLSAIHRFFYGALEYKPNDKKGMIYSLENFASLLAIGWLGLILGIMLSALLFGEVRVVIAFLLLSLYPILYLVLVSSCTALLYCKILQKIPLYIDNNSKWKIGTRIEGFLILFLAIFILTYHSQINEFIHS